MSKPDSIDDLLTAEERETLKSLPLKHGVRHPTWFPVFHANKSARDRETDAAVRRIASAGNAMWLQQAKADLVKWDTPSAASSVLAEMRAYGELLNAGLKVTPVPRGKASKPPATPDFEIDAGDGTVVLEVFAKHADQESAQIAPSERLNFAKRDGASVTMEVYEVAPGGAPDPTKPHDSVQANLVSRICGAKSSEHQWSDAKPAVLWIDLRSFGDFPEIVSAEQAEPVMAGREGLTSGALWYAFYGWKGAPIFEEDFFPQDRVVPMGHDGRFRMQGAKKSKLAACVLRLAEATIVFENPQAAAPLPGKARRHFLNLPRFDFGRSICEWDNGHTATQIELGARQIRSLAAWREKLCADEAE